MWTEKEKRRYSTFRTQLTGAGFGPLRSAGTLKWTQSVHTLNYTNVCIHKSVLKFANHTFWFSKQLRELVNLKEQAHKDDDMDCYRLPNPSD